LLRAWPLSPPGRRRAVPRASIPLTLCGSEHFERIRARH
jgi:hypothetical protein